jgi:hypothetical protein
MNENEKCIEKIAKEQDKILNEIVKNISENHHKIIDDWCKAYLAQQYQEGKEIKPNCFTLFHKQQDSLKGDIIHKYWFEPKEKEESYNDKLLKEVMEKLNRLIVFVEHQLRMCRGKTEATEKILLLMEINNFLNFSNKKETYKFWYDGDLEIRTCLSCKGSEVKHRDGTWCLYLTSEKMDYYDGYYNEHGKYPEPCQDCAKN